MRPFTRVETYSIASGSYASVNGVGGTLASTTFQIPPLETSNLHVVTSDAQRYHSQAMRVPDQISSDAKASVQVIIRTSY